MSQRLSVRLDTPAHEMAQEEIGKQVAYLTKGIANVRFAESGGVLEFDAPEGASADLASTAKALAHRVQRGLRSLQRKVAFRSSRMDRPTFKGAGPVPGVHPLGTGQVALSGLPLRLFRYFDRLFDRFGDAWKAEPVITPTLIPTRALAKCDYFRSFPHNVTFACHLVERPERIEDFRSRHHDRETLDQGALGDMEVPEACLSPAVCYHVYHMNEGQTLPATGRVYGICGKCFRYESSNLSDLRRLWDFTMREVVFLGGQQDVLEQRDRGLQMLSQLVEQHDLAGEIRTASDPFFIAPDAVAKTYFQLSAETKLEISLPISASDGGLARLAVGSLNYHTDFFGRAFNVAVEGTGPMHSVCIAFGLERWVYAFLAQHGHDPREWPECVRGAAELS